MILIDDYRQFVSANVTHRFAKHSMTKSCNCYQHITWIAYNILCNWCPLHQGNTVKSMTFNRVFHLTSGWVSAWQFCVLNWTNKNIASFLYMALFLGYYILGKKRVKQNEKGIFEATKMTKALMFHYVIPKIPNMIGRQYNILYLTLSSRLLHTRHETSETNIWHSSFEACDQKMLSLCLFELHTSC